MAFDDRRKYTYHLEHGRAGKKRRKSRIHRRRFGKIVTDSIIKRVAPKKH